VQPFQIIFNPTSAAELSRMPKELQLQILGQFRGLTRAGRTLTRYRLGEYRIYFERHPLGIVVHRILNKHSLKDFLFRSNLSQEEDASLAENPKFWELIEQSRSAAKSSE
jgi:mRNA-degrading endonuclease RelE of RelBE toxin-antitoxin system